MAGRVGDHAAHIAEAAYILATGRRPDAERRRLDESSSISGDTFTGALQPKD
jgi:phosphate uptake regulator